MTDLQRAITGIAKAQEKSGYDRGYDDGLKAAQNNIEAQHSSALPVQQQKDSISLKDEVFEWLGFCRDYMRPEDVSSLQKILKRSETKSIL